MDLVIRVLVGIPLFLIGGGIAWFVFNLLAGLVNGLAWALARGTRSIFGLHGTWAGPAQFALLSAMLAKSATATLIGVSILGYSFLYPWGAGFIDGVSALAGVAALALWMPAVFLTGLLLGDDLD